MDRTFQVATIVFIALAIVGVLLIVAAEDLYGANPGVFQSIGAALLASGLAAFLIEGYRWDRSHRI